MRIKYWWVTCSVYTKVSFNELVFPRILFSLITTLLPSLFSTLNRPWELYSRKYCRGEKGNNEMKKLPTLYVKKRDERRCSISRVNKDELIQFSRLVQRGGKNEWKTRGDARKAFFGDRCSWIVSRERRVSGLSGLSLSSMSIPRDIELRPGKASWIFRPGLPSFMDSLQWEGGKRGGGKRRERRIEFHASSPSRASRVFMYSHDHIHIYLCSYTFCPQRSYFSHS